MKIKQLRLENPKINKKQSITTWRIINDEYDLLDYCIIQHNSCDDKKYYILDVYDGGSPEKSFDILQDALDYLQNKLENIIKYYLEE
jgi:hypothetical protein